MSTVDGLPAHILLNHLVVVLGPLAAILGVVCAVWPAARRRLIWLALTLATITLIVTPLTINSGVWLAGRLGNSQEIEHHRGLGEILIYVIGALVVALTALAVVGLRVSRGRTVKPAAHIAVSVLVILASAATLVQTYRVGDSGARAAWGGLATASAQR
ncbi:DUF2231 domain-containing protein [Mycobacterium sp.]|uniref:DUF2231 domain-containing protein n=1 Tax=Mycobacterium sp. TaxID=1785 RepID=UPI003A8A994B